MSESTKSASFRRSPSRPKAVLFDHDGVLVTSEELHIQAWRKMLREIGVPYHEVDFQKYIGMHAPRILELILDEFRPGWSPSELDVHELAKRKNDIYLEIAKTQLTAYPGVVDGLKWLGENSIPAAVVSNARRRELMFSMDTLGLAPHFGAVISRDDALRPKPDPAPFELGAVSLGVEPKDCIAIDDTPTGLEAAWRAGCRLASVTTNYTADELRRVLPAPFRLEWVGPTMDGFFQYLKSLPEE